MSSPRTAAAVLRDHVTLEVDGLARMYLNLYVSGIQHDRGVVRFFRDHRGHEFASTASMSPMTVAFVKEIERFVECHGSDVVAFDEGGRKDDVAARYLGCSSRAGKRESAFRGARAA